MSPGTDHGSVPSRPIFLVHDGPGRSRKRGRWIVGLGVLAVAAALFFWTGSSRAGSPGAGTSPVSPSVSGEAAPVTPAATAGSRPGADPFAIAADSLGRSLAAYRSLQADFGRGRIDCAALAPGYRAVSERVLGLARERGGVGPARTAVFDSLMSVATGIDRQFDATGCPRP